MNRRSVIGWIGTTLALMHGAAAAQERVDIAFNRYSTYAELLASQRRIAEAYPGLVRLERLGTSRQGREMFVAIVTSPNGTPDTEKPAIWIDGNVHGNEIQAAEVVLYSLWQLTRSHGSNAKLTELMDRYTFYLLLSQNPDGREFWFEHANTSSSSRSNQRPVDSDRDGIADEDGDDDLDGDGSITGMWIEDPDGRWVRDRFDPRIFRRVEADQRGEWSFLGEEGLDNDGDGLINEDGPGGDDMNRNWPSDWKPEYVQGGAGEFPLSNPETRVAAEFILAHPNIAAGQSYHNAGGMILRGPGAAYRESLYGRDDVSVYDAIATDGEKMLPYYRSMVTYRDLYGVHGGFINWLWEGLGAYSFTNELWNEGKYFQRDVTNPDEEQMWLFRDRLEFGATFKDYTAFDHPRYGRVLVGGLNKWSSRATPTFMLEEECHRNFAFTMLHADAMPVVEFGVTEVTRVGGDGADALWSVTVEVKNTKLMPTRSGVQQRNGIGRNDLLVLEGAEVAASGRLRDRRDLTIDPVRFEPGRVQLASGVPGHGRVLHRFFVRGERGVRAMLRFESAWARDIVAEIVLEEGVE